MSCQGYEELGALPEFFAFASVLSSVDGGFGSLGELLGEASGLALGGANDSGHIATGRIFDFQIVMLILTS